MGNTISSQKKVKLEDVRQNNVVWTNLERDISESVFKDDFKRAVEIIQGIIDETDRQCRGGQTPCRQCKNRACSSCRHRDHGEYYEIEKPPVNRTKCHTAVPIIGERGTGKTSVMFSVLEYLKRYRGEGNETLPAFATKASEQGIRFITFDMIDAATLTSAEDVMEIILSRMLSYLEDLSGDLDFRDLYRQFDELHKNLGRVYGEKPNTREGYGLMSLQQLADSQKVIDDFCKLVDDFRKTVGRYRFGNCDCFLVVALDDVDLYRGAAGGLNRPQFALLEYIYNHMRIPGLVVLMTFNEYILRRICNRHFADIYYGKDKPRDWEHENKYQKERKDIENLTAQFMSKLFPQEQRIYLPEYTFVGADNRSDLSVIPEVYNEQKQKMETLAPFSNNDPLPAKEFMLRLIAHRTGVYFDAVGTKRHFFESRNLRELGEIFQIVNRMEDPGMPEEKDVAGQEKAKVIRTENRQKLLDYFYNRYALKRLNTKDYRAFQDLSMLPIDRQNVQLIDQIRLQMISKDEVGQKRWQYSYGELLRCIFCATRPEACITKDNTPLYSKEFVHCILGTHSAILNQMVHTDDRTELRKVIGSSIAGQWANSMIPSVTIDTADPVGGAGSMSKLPIRDYFNWKLPEDVSDAILHIGQEAETVKKYLEALLLTGMFFTGLDKKELKIKLEPRVEYKHTPEGEAPDYGFYLISESSDYACFNILNFVLNLDNADGYLDKMKEKLKKLGKDFSEKVSESCSDKWKTLETELQEKRAELDRVGARLDELNAVVNRFKRHDIWNLEMIHEDEANPEYDNAMAEMRKLREWRMLLKPQVLELVRENEINQFYLGLLLHYGFVSDEFNEKWKQIVDDLIVEYRQAVSGWRSEYGQKHAAVLPVEHFDMMYNIIKRVANRSHYDMPEQMSVDEVYTYCADLYKHIAEELHKQDDAYVLQGTDCFEEAFCECIFYKRYTDESLQKPNDPNNSNKVKNYIAQIQTDMMRGAVSKNATRAEHATIRHGR